MIDIKSILEGTDKLTAEAIERLILVTMLFEARNQSNADIEARTELVNPKPLSDSCIIDLNAVPYSVGAVKVMLSDLEKKLSAIQRGWRLPKLGDQVRCVKELSQGYSGAPYSALKLGEVYEVGAVCACDKLGLPPIDPDGYNKDPAYYDKRAGYGIKIRKDQSEWFVPLECFEPLPLEEWK